jgi:hypothetical protein
VLGPETKRDPRRFEDAAHRRGPPILMLLYALGRTTA